MTKFLTIIIVFLAFLGSTYAEMGASNLNKLIPEQILGHCFFKDFEGSTHFYAQAIPKNQSSLDDYGVETLGGIQYTVFPKKGYANRFSEAKVTSSSLYPNLRYKIELRATTYHKVVIRILNNKIQIDFYRLSNGNRNIISQKLQQPISFRNLVTAFYNQTSNLPNYLLGSKEKSAVNGFKDGIIFPTNINGFDWKDGQKYKIPKNLGISIIGKKIIRLFNKKDGYLVSDGKVVPFFLFRLQTIRYPKLLLTSSDTLRLKNEQSLSKEVLTVIKSLHAYQTRNIGESITITNQETYPYKASSIFPNLRKVQDSFGRNLWWNTSTNKLQTGSTLPYFSFCENQNWKQNGKIAEVNILTNQSIVVNGQNYIIEWNNNQKNPFQFNLNGLPSNNHLTRNSIPENLDIEPGSQKLTEIPNLDLGDNSLSRGIETPADAMQTLKKKSSYLMEELKKEHRQEQELDLSYQGDGKEEIIQEHQNNNDQNYIEETQPDNTESTDSLDPQNDNNHDSGDENNSSSQEPEIIDLDAEEQ